MPLHKYKGMVENLRCGRPVAVPLKPVIQRTSIRRVWSPVVMAPGSRARFFRRMIRLSLALIILVTGPIVYRCTVIVVPVSQLSQFYRPTATHHTATPGSESQTRPVESGHPGVGSTLYKQRVNPACWLRVETHWVVSCSTAHAYVCRCKGSGATCWRAVGWNEANNSSIVAERVDGSGVIIVMCQRVWSWTRVQREYTTCQEQEKEENSNHIELSYFLKSLYKKIRLSTRSCDFIWCHVPNISNYKQYVKGIYL